MLPSSTRAADWLIAQMNLDGSLRGAASINEYYKTVYAFACAGRHTEADLMMRYIEERFLTKDGDLDGTGCEWFPLFRIYCHPWIAIAAIMRARFDIASNILRFLEPWQDPETGGFYGTVEERSKQGEQEMMTTGLAGLAMLWGGRIESAQRTAHWMKQVWESQPDIKAGLYFVWHHQDGLVRKFSLEAAKGYMVNTHDLAQRYYQYGIAAAFLSSYAGLTGEAAWLDLAREYLQACRHCREDVFRRPQSGKLGWAAAWLYRLARDPRDREIAERVREGLGATQQAEGWWPTANVYGQEKSEAFRPALDLTGEFLGHLSWMEQALQ